jgi:hypothetical protein
MPHTQSWGITCEGLDATSCLPAAKLLLVLSIQYAWLVWVRRAVVPCHRSEDVLVLLLLSDFVLTVLATGSVAPLWEPHCVL